MIFYIININDKLNINTNINGGSSDKFNELCDIISPPIEILKADNATVLTDANLLGGTKQRVFSYYLGTLDESEVVYAGTSIGYGQIALAIGGLIWNKKITLFLHSTIENNLTKISKYLGAHIISKNCTLKEIENEANTYVKNNLNCKLLKLGGEGSPYSDVFKCYKWAMARILDNIDIKTLWIVVGSGFTFKVLNNLYPKIHFNIVEVGKVLYDDKLKGINYTKFKAPEKFTENTKKLPPYNSLSNYDAKVWQFYDNKESHIFNIAGNPVLDITKLEGIKNSLIKLNIEKEDLFNTNSTKVFKLYKLDIKQERIKLYFNRYPIKNEKDRLKKFIKDIEKNYNIKLYKRKKQNSINICYFVETKIGFDKYFDEVIYTYYFDKDIKFKIDIFNPIFEYKFKKCKLASGHNFVSVFDKKIVKQSIIPDYKEVSVGDIDIDFKILCDINKLNDKISIEYIRNLNVVYGETVMNKLLSIADNIYDEYEVNEIIKKIIIDSNTKVKINPTSIIMAWIYKKDVICDENYFYFT